MGKYRIGLKEEILKPEKVPTVVTLCVSVFVRATGYAFWPRNLIFRFFEISISTLFMSIFRFFPLYNTGIFFSIYTGHSF